MMEPFPITVTAPRSNETRMLKTTRAAGAGTSTAGAGMMAYAAVAGAIGPIGWIAAIFIIGGMTVSYLSNRRLEGHDDFSWGLQQENESELPPENSTGRLEASRPNP